MSIPVLPLSVVFHDYVTRTVDFLKIDAESHELEVLAGADLSNCRPRAIVIESNGWPTREPLLITADYLLSGHDGVNRYYIRVEDRDLVIRLQDPVNVTDEFTPYKYHKRISDLEERLSFYESGGLPTYAFFNDLRTLSIRHPKLSNVVKAILARVSKRDNSRYGVNQ